jgi:hypothetical protein
MQTDVFYFGLTGSIDSLSKFVSNAWWAWSLNISELAPLHESQCHPLRPIILNKEKDLQSIPVLCGSSVVRPTLYSKLCHNRVGLGPRGDLQPTDLLNTALTWYYISKALLK